MDTRAGFDVYRDALNTPSFLAMLPPIAGLSGLDVACGEGSNTRHLGRAGARMHAIDIAPAFIRHACAQPGSFLQFSILHPCFVPPYRKTLREPDGHVRAIEVGRYFDAVDGEVEHWWFESLPKAERSQVPPFAVPRFHRTLSQWVRFICGAGLVIEELGEPCASPELAQAEPVVADTQVAPIFLHFRARKPVNTR